MENSWDEKLSKMSNVGGDIKNDNESGCKGDIRDDNYKQCKIQESLTNCGYENGSLAIRYQVKKNEENIFQVEQEFNDAFQLSGLTLENIA